MIISITGYFGQKINKQEKQLIKKDFQKKFDFLTNPYLKKSDTLKPTKGQRRIKKKVQNMKELLTGKVK